MKIVSTVMGLMLSVGLLSAGTFKVDKDHSDVTFKVKHMMVSYVRGSFDSFSGSFEFDEKNKKLLALNGTIEVDSINTKNAKRDGHLKSADFFNVASYPTMKYVLTKVKGDKAYGKLTLHGVTKEVNMELETNGVITDPWGNKRTGMSLSGKISRKAFGLSWNKMIEAGGVVVGDTIKLSLEIEGIAVK